MSDVKRIYVEKKEPYAVKARELKEDIESYLSIQGVTGVRELIRYDVEGINDDVYATATKMIFSEPPVDDYYEETYPIAADEKAFSVEALPGQFDQRADSAEQCIGFIDAEAKPIVKSAIHIFIRYVTLNYICNSTLYDWLCICIDKSDTLLC